MRRDTLELADDSLFIEYTNHAYKAADAYLLTEAFSFLNKTAFGFDSIPFQAAKRLFDDDADAVIIADALLDSLIWQDLANPGEVRKPISRNVTTALENLSFPPTLRIDNLNFNHAT